MEYRDASARIAPIPVLGLPSEAACWPVAAVFPYLPAPVNNRLAKSA